MLRDIADIDPCWHVFPSCCVPTEEALYHSEEKKMMLRWVTGLLLCLLMLPSLPVIADDGLEEALRDLPPREREMYRQELLQLDRVARRLLNAIPNAPQVNFVLAAGENSINAGS